MLKKSDEFDMNHVNVVLQSLYSLWSLRAAVFDSSSSNCLELIFAKIYYDLENEKGATESSIYFNDSYLSTEGSPSSHHHTTGALADITSTDSVPIISPALTAKNPNEPVKFFHWLSRQLFKDPKYRELMQWQLTTIRQGEHEEKLIEDNYDIFAIEPFSSSTSADNSIQSHLDELFARKIEIFSVTIDGVRQEKTREIFKEFTNLPEILTFLITEREIRLDTSITLPNGNFYKLTSVIYKEQDSGDYSVALRHSDGYWIRLQDDEAIQEVSFDTFSHIAHMAFYTYSTCSFASPCLESLTPKPSQQLIMECLTKNYRHSISKAVKRQLTNTHSSSPTLTRQSSGTAPLPSKSKQMTSAYLSLSGQLAYLANFETDIFPSRSDSAKMLTLPTLPIKHSLSDDADIAQQLNCILVPEDLSHIQMNLVTTGPFNNIEAATGEQVRSDRKAAAAAVESGIDPADERESSDDFVGDDFNLFKKKISPPKRVESEDGDFELDYFEEVPRKGSSVWNTYYLNISPLRQQKQPDQKRRNCFSGLMDFGTEFNREKERSKAPSAAALTDLEMFKQAASAKITKTLSNGNEQLEDTAAHYIPQSSSKTPSAAPSNGLFFRSRSTAAVLPLSSSQDGSEMEKMVPNHGELKIKSTYSRL